MGGKRLVGMSFASPTVVGLVASLRANEVIRDHYWKDVRLMAPNGLAIELLERQLTVAYVEGLKLTSRATHPLTGSESLVSVLREAVQQVTKSSDPPTYPELSLAVSGRFNPKTGVWTSHPAGLWVGINLIASLRTDSLPPIQLHRLGEAVAEAQRLYGPVSEYENFLSLYVTNDDIYGGYYRDHTSDQVIRGSFGHLILKPMAPETCSCGVPGTLSAFASAFALVRQYNRRGGMKGASHEAMLRRIVAEASDSRQPATAVIADAGSKIATAVCRFVTGDFAFGAAEFPAAALVIDSPEPGLSQLLAAATELSIRTEHKIDLDTYGSALGISAPLAGSIVLTQAAYKTRMRELER
jgi:predicted NBD/HSP70 family sugar kinase